MTGPPGTLDFRLDAELEAHEPPEAGGRRRDDVRLLVSRGESPPVHSRFRMIGEFLDPGDLVVVNTSATVAAAVDATAPDGTRIEVHLSTELPSGLWLLELRDPGRPASRPWAGDLGGTTLDLPHGATVDVLARFRGSKRLWLAVVRTPGTSVLPYLAHAGRPIRYAHVPAEWPLSYYQTAFSRLPGSAEMPSAARPLTAELVTELVAKGVAVSPVVLHTGVSSLEGAEKPYPERYEVPAETAARVNDTRAYGGRVVAVGTTVVRALETVVGMHGRAHAGTGWTDLVVTPERGVCLVDGMLTGWHEPEASHLLMVEAVAGRRALEAAYRAAVGARYRWHEFGDAHLILPGEKR